MYLVVCIKNNLAEYISLQLTGQKSYINCLQRVATGQGLASKKRPITATLDRYLKKHSPAKYQPNSVVQRRIDLDLMAYLATTNLPFSHVETRGFKRWEIYLYDL